MTRAYSIEEPLSWQRSDRNTPARLDVSVALREASCTSGDRPHRVFRFLVAGLLSLFMSSIALCANYPTVIDDGADLYQGGSTGLGLPTWRVSEPFESLWIHYRAIEYRTSAGKTINLDIAYRQRSPGANFNPFGFGPSWRFGWLGTISYDVETEQGVPWYTDSSTWDITPPFGGSPAYSSDPTAPEYNTYSKLSHSSVDTCGTTFNVTYPDGTMYSYGYRRACQYCFNTCLVHYTNYLNEVIDPQGRKLELNYITNSHGILLSSLVDYDGRTNFIYYDSIFTTNISLIVDPYGRTNSFLYDSGGRLTNIINSVGMSTSFAYDTAGAITNMITPYGTNCFQYTVNTNTGNLVNRSILVSEPEGRTQLFAYRHQATYLNTNGTTALIPFSYPTNQLPCTLIPTNVLNSTNVAFTNTFDNTWMDARDSFHWSPAAYSQLSSNFLQSMDFNNMTTNDYLLATLNHWLLEDVTGTTVGNTISLIREPSPDGATEGQKTWFDYWGKTAVTTTNGSVVTTNYFCEGSGANPSFTATVLPDGSTRFIYQVLNSWGLPVTNISTYSASLGVGVRTNAFIYGNNFDLVSQVGPLGECIVSNVYNSAHQITTNYDALNQQTTFTYNQIGQISAIALPSGLTITNIYFSGGSFSNFLQQTVALEISRTNSFSYTNGLIMTATDSRGLQIAFTWDALQRITRAAFQDGTSISNTYTRLDLSKISDRLGYSTYFGYNGLRQRTVETNALGMVTQYTFCPCGALESMVDALHNTTAYTHDVLGRVVSINLPDNSNVSYYYNSMNQITNIVEPNRGNLTNWINNQGLVYATSNYFGLVQSKVFDIEDRATDTIDANNVRVTFTYDKLGRIQSRSYPDTGTESFGYSARGRTSYTNQLGYASFYAYDPGSQMIFETNANSELTQLQYSPAGDISKVIDGKTQSTSFYYDCYGRLTNKVNAVGNSSIVYGYDPNGQLTNRWTPAKGTTTYYYDPVGNLTNVVYPLNSAIVLQYDPVNRLTNMVDGVGNTRFTYDGVGQLISETGPWPDDTVSYVYSNRLRANLSLIAPNTSPWIQNYTYDNGQRLRSLASPAGSFVYGYDSKCQTRIASLALPNNAYVTNTFDSLARQLCTILENSTNGIMNSHSYGYDLVGARRWLTNVYGDYHAFTYDKISQLVGANGYESNGLARLQEKLGYQYDAAHNLNWRTNNGFWENFSVDSLNDLTVVSSASTNLTVAGSASSTATNVNISGNGIPGSQATSLYSDHTWAFGGVNPPNGQDTFTAVAQDGLNRRDTNSVTINVPANASFTYDSNGNLLNDGKRNFVYDDENQLTSVWVTNGCRSDFVYDGKMRRRIHREYTWSSGVWLQTNEIHFIYDGNLVIQERDANNFPLVSYTRGPDLSGAFQGAGGIGGLLARSDHRLLAIGSPSAHAYYHQDCNGNVTCLISSNQLIAARYVYDPFGVLIGKSGALADANLYRFSGKEIDLNSGLYAYLLRYYDPTFQRWISKDPIQEGGGLNLCGFVKNDPTDLVDPSGETYWLWQPNGSGGGSWVLNPSLVLGPPPGDNWQPLMPGDLTAPGGGVSGSGDAKGGSLGHGNQSNSSPTQKVDCGALAKGINRVDNSVRGALRSMGDINKMFDSAKTSADISLGIAIVSGLKTVIGLGDELAVNASKTAPIFTGARNGMLPVGVFTQSGTVGLVGSFEFNYTTYSAASARNFGAAFIAGKEAGQELGQDAAGDFSKAAQRILDPFGRAADVQNETGAEMSADTYETVNKLLGTLREMLSTYRLNCK